MKFKNDIAKEQVDVAKYPVKKIYLAYAYEEKVFYAPFVFNDELTKIKDLKTGTIISAPKGRFTHENIKNALRAMYNIKDVRYSELYYVILHNTKGPFIPGKAFAKFKMEILLEEVRGEFTRNDVFRLGSFSRTLVSYNDLKPFLIKLYKQAGVDKTDINKTI